MFGRTVGQIAILYAFAGVGLLLSCTKALPKDASRTISTMLAKFFLPCMLISTISSQFSVALVKEYLLYLVAGAATAGLLWFPVRKFSDRLLPGRPERGILAYALLFPNVSYLGYPLAQSVLTELYMPLVIFGLPFTLVANTLGLRLISPKSEKPGVWQFLSPPVIGVIGGVLLALAPFELPDIPASFLASASACTSPLAMLLTGIVVDQSRGYRSGKDVQRAVGLVTAIRLAALPLAGAAVAALACMGLRLSYSLVGVVAASLCLPCGMNMIFLSEANGLRGDVGAKCTLATNAAGIVTIPLIYAVIAALV